MSTTVRKVELVPLAELRDHPRNYREHPADQREHIRRSLEEHGVYRNVVIARDGTILAGHGVVKTARELDHERILAIRLDIAPTDPAALKILTGDNEIARLAEIDDRELAELLREVRDEDPLGLLGTGYDDTMLANLVYVTRDESEIADRDDAAAWVGMPEFDGGAAPYKLVINLDSEDDRERLMSELGIDTVHQRHRRVWSVWWPPREREDASSLRFDE